MLTTNLDFQLADGTLRQEAEVTFHYRVAGNAWLGYVTPIQARGIFDVETKSFTTVHFDLVDGAFPSFGSLNLWISAYTLRG